MKIIISPDITTYCYVDDKDNMVDITDQIPYRLRELGIPEEACNIMAKEAMKQTRLLVNNPRKIEESDAFNIYKAAW